MTAKESPWGLHPFGGDSKLIGFPDELGRYLLKRFRLLRTPPFGLFLHRHFRADADRYPHDHPWPFISIVLRGGYTEMVTIPATRPGGKDLTVRRHHRRWSIHRMPRTGLYHRITNVADGTWTLILRGPDRFGRGRPDWGFWIDGEWVHWAKYLGEQYGQEALDGTAASDG